MMTAIPSYIDGSYSSAIACGPPVFSSPLPGIPDQVMCEQEFTCWNGSFTPTPLNTLHPDTNSGVGFWAVNAAKVLAGTATNFYLTSESSREDIGGGLVKWKRTYCQVPNSRLDISTISYQFPGLAAYSGTYPSGAIVTLRTPITKAAPCKIVYDYFLCGTGGTYSDASAIPVISQTRYVSGIYNGAILVGLKDVPVLMPSVIGTTIPTYEQYVSGIASNSPNTTFLGGTYPIVVQASECSRWNGLIFQRVTKLIPAL
jgi:hypothetical protein